MNHAGIVCIFSLVALSSCHLTEAEQRDSSRNGIESGDSSTPSNTNDPATPTVSYQGENAIPLSELLTANWIKDYASKFVVNDPDKSTDNNDWKWKIQATRDDIVLFSFRVRPSGSQVQLYQTTGGSDWANDLASIKWHLLRATGDGWDDNWVDTHSSSASLLKIIDDRIPVSLRFLSDSSRVKSGDTIRIEMMNKSSKDTTLVASDYSGMRMVGKYDAKLGPGASTIFQWLVLAAPGYSAWLEISWSRAGQSKRFTFPIR